MPAKTVLIVEPNRDVRAGLRAQIDADPRFRVSAAPLDVFALTKCVQRRQPDVVVLASPLRGLSLAESARAVRDHAPGAYVLGALDIFATPDVQPAEIIAAGLSGFCVRGSQSMRAALDSAASGQAHISARVMGQLVAPASPDQNEHAPPEVN